MLSHKLVLSESKNFTSGRPILAPPTIPINHYFSTRNQQNRTEVLDYYSMLMYSQQKACFKHSNFFKVKDLDRESGPVAQVETFSRRMANAHRHSLKAGQARCTRNPTTSFLTATTLIYALGAGITAAAGTRLALQWILVKGFKLYSLQLPDLKKPGIVIFCHYLSVSELGNLRACCLPWMW